jgi:hypothetical protein
MEVCMEKSVSNNETKAIMKLFVISDGKEMTGEVTGNRIALVVDGIGIEGVIDKRTANEIGVRIEKPYCGVSKSSGSIQLMLTKFINYLGNSGNKKAMSMLYDLYRFCSWVETRKTELASALDRYDLKIEYETFFEPTRQIKQERINELFGLILDIRKKLKAGEIDNIAYQRQIKPIRKELKLLGRDTEIDTGIIFRECFWGFGNTPMKAVSKDTVISYLRTVIT